MFKIKKTFSINYTQNKMILNQKWEYNTKKNSLLHINNFNDMTVSQDRYGKKDYMRFSSDTIITSWQK